MAASVRIEGEAYSDLRFVTLARIMGFADADHALIKTSRIWAWQTEHYTPEAPTYVVEPDIADAALGIGGAAALVRCKLAEEVPEGLRMCGTVGRIEWRWALKSKGQRGGEATKRKWADKTGPGGMAGAEPDGPAQLSPPSPTPSLPDQISLPRAIPPSTEYGQQVPAPPAATPPPVPQPGKSAWHRRSAWWALMLEADARVRAAGIEPNAPPMPKQCAGENERNLNACEKQLLEGGDDAETVDRKLRHLIAYRERECIRDRTRRWLSPAALWDPKRANYAYDRPLDEADKSPMGRAGPRGSAGRAEPQQTIRPKHTEDDVPPIPSWSSKA